MKICPIPNCEGEAESFDHKGKRLVRCSNPDCDMSLEHNWLGYRAWRSLLRLTDEIAMENCSNCGCAFDADYCGVALCDGCVPCNDTDPHSELKANLCIDNIPRAQRYELQDVRVCGQAWREMEEVPDDLPDEGDLYVKADTHMVICKDLALAVELGKAHTGTLTKERDLLLAVLRAPICTTRTCLPGHGCTRCDSVQAWKKWKEEVSDATTS